MDPKGYWLTLRGDLTKFGAHRSYDGDIEYTVKSLVDGLADKSPFERISAAHIMSGGDHMKFLTFVSPVIAAESNLGVLGYRPSGIFRASLVEAVKQLEEQFYGVTDPIALLGASPCPGFFDDVHELEELQEAYEWMSEIFPPVIAAYWPEVFSKTLWRLLQDVGFTLAASSVDDPPLLSLGDILWHRYQPPLPF